MNDFMEVKDEIVCEGREVALGALMCLALYLLVELGRQMGKNKRR